jgi:hypothetical protein
MNKDYVIIAIFSAPIWLPLTRFAIYLVDPGKRWQRASSWFYGIAFILATGGATFHWVNRIPSGIIIGIILIVALIILFFGIVLDIALLPPSKSAKNDQ